MAFNTVVINQKPHIIAAGLAPDLTGWLQLRLENAAVQGADDIDDALAAVARSGSALLIINHTISGIAGTDLLNRVRAMRTPADLPVIYMLDRALDSVMGRQMLDQLGVSMLLLNPVDRDEVASEAARALGLSLNGTIDPPRALTRNGHGGPPITPVDSALTDSLEDEEEAQPLQPESPEHRLLEAIQALERVALAALAEGLPADRASPAIEQARVAAQAGIDMGAPRVVDLAHEVEDLLTHVPVLEHPHTLRLSELLSDMRRELQPDEGGGEGPASSYQPAPTLTGEHAFLLVVDDDRAAAERIVLEASARGMETQSVVRPQAAREAMRIRRPDVVLLDLAFPDTADDGLSLLKDLSGQVPPIPVLVLTARDSFIDRVQVASLGGRGFLHKTTPPGEVIDRVTRLLQQLRTSESRVMAVDDDPVTLSRLRELLEPQGIHLTVLDDPLRFWDTLEQSAPDLLVLNQDMPRLSGIELCRVVRNDTRWGALPVLFLTSASDPETVLRVFAAGADDFVSKPIVGPELVTKIVNRLERTLLYRNMAETDPLTGVANRRKSMDMLEQFLRLAKRHNQPLSLALLDIDHFKQINDRLGHGTGDTVLQQLGKLLLRTFRSEDVVARWGGEEFLVGMYGMTRVDGVQRLTDLLDTLRHETLPGPRGERIRITFSAGVAQYPEDGTDVQALYRAADGALYRAKEAGRDQVMPVGWQAESVEQESQVTDVVIVEDDEVLGNLLVHTLETRGYRTQWLKDGEVAALMLGGMDPSLRAQVLLLDADVPGLDGMGVLRRLARDGLLKRTRVIMLMPRSHMVDLDRADEMGAFDHVIKPFSLPVLLQRVRRAMEIL